MPTRVVVLPCMTVARPHVREAFRALVGQGFARDLLTDDVVAELLWLARALPAVVDVMDGLSLVDVCFGPAVIEVLARPPDRGPLQLVAWRRDDESFVEAIVLTPQAFEQRAFDQALVRVAVTVKQADRCLSPGTDDDVTAEDVVRVQRFTVGR